MWTLDGSMVVYKRVFFVVIESIPGLETVVSSETYEVTSCDNRY